jgi:hypothetical protein
MLTVVQPRQGERVVEYQLRGFEANTMLAQVLAIFGRIPSPGHMPPM